MASPFLIVNLNARSSLDAYFLAGGSGSCSSAGAGAAAGAGGAAAAAVSPSWLAFLTEHIWDSFFLSKIGHGMSVLRWTYIACLAVFVPTNSSWGVFFEWPCQCHLAVILWYLSLVLFGLGVWMFYILWEMRKERSQNVYANTNTNTFHCENNQ